MINSHTLFPWILFILLQISHAQTELNIESNLEANAFERDATVSVSTAVTIAAGARLRQVVNSRDMHFPVSSDWFPHLWYTFDLCSLYDVQDSYYLLEGLVRMSVVYLRYYVPNA